MIRLWSRLSKKQYGQNGKQTPHCLLPPVQQSLLSLLFFVRSYPVEVLTILLCP